MCEKGGMWGVLVRLKARQADPLLAKHWVKTALTTKFHCSLSQREGGKGTGISTYVCCIRMGNAASGCGLAELV